MGLVAFMVPMALYFAIVIDARIFFASIVNANVILIVAYMWYSVRHFLKQVWHGNQVRNLLKYAKTERSLSVLIFLLVELLCLLF